MEWQHRDLTTFANGDTEETEYGLRMPRDGPQDGAGQITNSAFETEGREDRSQYR